MTRFGKFALKDESFLDEDESDNNTSKTFSTWKFNNKQLSANFKDTSATLPIESRQTTTGDRFKATASEKNESSRQGKKLVSQDSRGDISKASVSKKIEKSPQEKQKKDETVKEARNKKEANSEERNSPGRTEQNKKRYRPFNQLLRGIVFTISGLENPGRANLKAKALAMGAVYKADWGPDCTHLICPFKNTPKTKQAQNGKIVTPKWIEKCHTSRKYFPWRRFALREADMDFSESDEEILDESLKNSSDNSQEPLSRGIRSNNQIEKRNINNEECNRREDQSAKTPKKCKQGQALVSDKSNESKSDKQSIYDISTDEEDYLKHKILKIRKTKI